MTNVFGTRNVIDVAIEMGAECVVNVSTDKAADPTSVLGATKLLAEKVAANAAHASGTRVVSVRFGNVLGSRGSVLPTFLNQIASGGPVTVTHPDVTRYFMTIPEAVRLVLEAGAIGSPGEIMILDMGEPVPIVDLAQRLIDHHKPGVDIEFTGLRPGEKLHEILVAGHERGEIREHPRIFHTVAGRCSELDEMLAELEGRHLQVTAEEVVKLATATTTANTTATATTTTTTPTTAPPTVATDWQLSG
jgi:dTDP-glucose 4,6-dehydratase